ncbi:IS3 family transposase [Burkholderia glumae]|nr:IS3 family transposase [Burkholderia glumae]
MKKKVRKFAPEVRERAVRLVREQRTEHPSTWAAVESIAPVIGCAPRTLLHWIRREAAGRVKREGVGATERERIEALEREVERLRRTNEVLKLASALFVQAELGRRVKP